MRIVRNRAKATQLQSLEPDGDASDTEQEPDQSASSICFMGNIISEKLYVNVKKVHM